MGVGDRDSITTGQALPLQDRRGRGGGWGLATAMPALAALGSALGGACASPHPLCPLSPVLAGLAGKRGHSHHPGPTLDGVPEMHAAGQTP